MIQSLIVVAALRDLVIWLPVLVIIAVLHSFGIRFRFGPRSVLDYDDDKE